MRSKVGPLQIRCGHWAWSASRVTECSALSYSQYGAVFATLQRLYNTVKNVVDYLSSSYSLHIATIASQQRPLIPNSDQYMHSRSFFLHPIFTMPITELVFPQFKTDEESQALLATSIITQLPTVFDSSVEGLHVAYQGPIIEEDGVHIDDQRARAVFVLGTSHDMTVSHPDNLC